jgi:hypothetical protein
MYLLENIKKGQDLTYTITDRGETVEVTSKVFAIVGNKVMLLDGHIIYAF